MRGRARKINVLLPLSSCCICYDDIGNEEWVTVLVCKHTHHCECIKDWLLKQKICPICKKEVPVIPFSIRRRSREKM